jgi:hypothetical protein
LPPLDKLGIAVGSANAKISRDLEATRSQLSRKPKPVHFQAEGY